MLRAGLKARAGMTGGLAAIFTILRPSGGMSMGCFGWEGRNGRVLDGLRRMGMAGSWERGLEAGCEPRAEGEEEIHELWR